MWTRFLKWLGIFGTPEDDRMYSEIDDELSSRGL